MLAEGKRESDITTFMMRTGGMLVTEVKDMGLKSVENFKKGTASGLLW